ncbi:zinc finger MYM-type protein 1-like [Melanaphis sacchari]|uniref:zinc finger MYM-type protein 1-like n=1 Tax=Melanaphis sacchari TaxID=742174 RepID=UPI000DC1520B|nr:zinc finger MYM-type protein 1-like [Melanaphis sacchari]
MTKYISPEIQNDIIKATSKLVLQLIINEVHIGSQIFSLIVDEARDQSKTEQMSICIRYLHNLKIKERFLGFVELNELNAQALCDGIIFFLNNVGLDISNCVSQSYDGASVMSGAFSSVQTKIRELAQNPCPYIHCHAHRLNLVLVDVTKNIQEVDEILGLLEAIYAFQSVSTIRHHAFLKETKYKVPQHCETRGSTKKQEAAEAKEVKKYKVGFEELTKIIENLLVVPVSSASAERSFSTMKRVKTYLRSTMTSSRLNNLTLLSIEREISGNFIENPSAILPNT